jgi:hypothetical protein
VCARLAAGALMLTDVQVGRAEAEHADGRPAHDYGVTTSLAGLQVAACRVCHAVRWRAAAGTPFVEAWARPSTGTGTFMVPAGAHVKWCGSARTPHG